MSLLSDEEIRAWWASENGLEDCQMCKLDDFSKVARAIEAAILAKLAAKELPEPVGKLRGDEFDGHAFEPSLDWPFGDLYTAAQLHEAHAQGAASQLSAEPTAQITMHDDGYWIDPLIHLWAIEDGTHKLYTRKEAK